MRRGVNKTYILENNWVYGLTKGQFSATADKGSKAKTGAINSDAPVDTVSLALLMGATFVARSFSGDEKQLVPLVQAAIAHSGAAFIDVVRPCVAFNNHAGSTKSHEYIREHNETVNRLDFWPTRESTNISYEEGGAIEVPQHDGSIIKLRKLQADYDPSDKINTQSMIARAAFKGEVLTGLLYLAPDAEDLHAHLNTYEAPSNRLGEKDLCPGSVVLSKISASLRLIHGLNFRPPRS
jgi:2-oxoglutarate/2-oxoacid ferredoxin oxidoreductase subunit beta